MQDSNNTKTPANRQWKSSIFSTFFGKAENAAELYRVLQPDYSDILPEDIHFQTLDDVLFMARKNDLAFTVDNKILVISEHQSTVNPNMPLRSAIYFGRTIEKLFTPTDIYRTQPVMIPTPEFYVFYNGIEPQPLEETLRISDVYLEKSVEPMLELTVKVININLLASHDILTKSRAMYEYSWMVQRVRDYLNIKLDISEAIKRTVKDCLKEGVMVDFIREHGSEVYNMLFEPFNLETAKKVWAEENIQIGIAQGEKIGFAKGEEIGLAKGEEIGFAKQTINLVLKKIEKNKSLFTIADELECDISLVEKISVLAHECDFDMDLILTRYFS